MDNKLLVQLSRICCRAVPLTHSCSDTRERVLSVAAAAALRKVRAMLGQQNPCRRRIYPQNPAAGLSWQRIVLGAFAHKDTQYIIIT